MAALLAEMVLQYVQRDASQALNDWLADALVQRTGASPEAARATADSITSYLQQSHHLRADLRAHVEQGKSRSSWWASQIERIASDHQATQPTWPPSAQFSGQTSAEGVHQPARLERHQPHCLCQRPGAAAHVTERSTDKRINFRILDDSNFR